MSQADNKLQGLASQVLYWESEKDKAEQRLKDAREALAQGLAAAGQKSTTAVIGNTRHSFSIGSRRTLKIDETGLRKALGARVFNKFTVRKLDRKKFEHAVDTGEIDPLMVSQYIAVDESDQFVTHRVKEADTA